MISGALVQQTIRFSLVPVLFLWGFAVHGHVHIFVDKPMHMSMHIFCARSCPFSVRTSMPMAICRVLVPRCMWIPTLMSQSQTRPLLTTVRYLLYSMRACMNVFAYITTSHNSFCSSVGWNECGCGHCCAMPDHVTALPQKHDGLISGELKLDGAGVYSTDCTRLKIERSQFLRNKATVRCHRHRCCGTILVRLHCC